MKILTISGSSRPESSNTKLLSSLSSIKEHQFQLADIIHSFPLFQAHIDHVPPKEVMKFKSLIDDSDLVIISIPEYIHNMPAVIKNALEWTTSAGNFVGKPVIPITYTPHEPRGEKAMKSLLWTLLALDARIITQLNLYHSDILIENNKIIGGEGIELIREAIKLV